MRLLMLNYEFPPIGGGTGNANRYLLKEFAKMKDIKIDLITSSLGGYAVEQFSEKIRIYKLDVGKKDIHHWTHLEIIRYMRHASRLFKTLVATRNYDFCVAWGGFPCGVVAKRQNIPYVVLLRGSDVPGFNKRFDLQYLFLKPVIVNVWRNAEKVIANSEELKKLALKSADIDIDVIPNGIDLEEFTPKSDYGDRRILCVARLIERKGIRYLIEAMKDVDGELSIIGEGKQEQELKSLATKLGVRKKIWFFGYIPHGKLGEHYHDADLFVLPSLSEGMSNTILEAMASGLPIITTKTSIELLSGYLKHGYLIPTKSSAGISRAINYYFSNPELISSNGGNSRKLAEEMGWNKIAEEYLKILMGVER